MTDAINLARLRDLFCDDEASLLELLRATLDESRTAFERISDAVSRKDANDAAFVAHDLKGFAGNVGADCLSELSGKLESAVLALNWQAASTACAALGLEVSRVKAFATALLPSGEV